MKIKLDRTFGGVFGLFFFVMAVFLLYKKQWLYGFISLGLAIICMFITILPDWLLARQQLHIRRKERKKKMDNSETEANEDVKENEDSDK